MGVWLSSELGKGEGSEEEDCRLTSVTPFPVRVASSSHFPRMAIMGYGGLYPFVLMLVYAVMHLPMILQGEQALGQ